MKRFIINLWLGIVSLIFPDPNGEATPDQQREEQAATFLLLCFVCLLAYANWRGWIRI